MSYILTMPTHGEHLEFPIAPTLTKTVTFVEVHPRTIHATFGFRKYLNIFPLGSNVKTMCTDVSHLEWKFGSGNILLKVYHPRTIHAMFGLDWLSGVRG